ncbi:MAG: PmoA family protein [Chitinophagaceae bacterium]
MKQVDVYFNNKLLTAYCYYDSSRKPILFPVNTPDGITVTRGFPFQPEPGERTDHPHHAGIWLNYESVNGLDFWNNSTAISPEKRYQYGSIVHQGIVNKNAKGNEASLTTTARWIRPDNVTLLNEKTTFLFHVDGNTFIIDRLSTLTAADTTVLFKDVKDGMLAIRVARELELPSTESSSYIDDKGNITEVPGSGNNVTGMYYSSNGLKGDSVWGTKGKWVMLTGRKENKKITIAIIDHPSNIGYPAYWHARGYGLFAVNPLGRKIFSKGAEELNYSLSPGQSLTFRYRVIVHSGSYLSTGQMDKLSYDFDQLKDK